MEQTYRSFKTPAIAQVFLSYPETLRSRLLFLRELIFQVASETEGLGTLEEELKWGQPSYITVRPRSGSTVRIDRVKDAPQTYALYFHCQTTLIDDFKEIYGNKFTYEGNRAIVFREGDAIPVEELKHCISLALTYHLNRKKPTKRKDVRLF